MFSALVAQGFIRDLRIPCRVAGMERSIILALQGDCGGLEVSYSVLDEDKNERFDL